MLRLNVRSIRGFSTKIDLKELLNRMKAENAKNAPVKPETVGGAASTKISGLFNKDNTTGATPTSASAASTAAKSFKKPFSFDGTIAGAKPVSQMGSIRDSFRKVEQDTRGPQPPRQVRQSARPPEQHSSRSSASSIRDDVLKEAKKTDTGVGIESKMPVDELTEGEKRYLQYKQHLSIKREIFNRSMPEPPKPPRYVKNEPREDPPEPLTRKSSTKGLPVIDFAEMKRQLQLNIQRKQSEAGTSFESSNRDFDKEKKKQARATNKSKGNVSYQEMMEQRRKLIQTGNGCNPGITEVEIPPQGMYLKELSSILGMKVDPLANLLTKMGETINRQVGKDKFKNGKRVKNVGVVEDRLIDPDALEIFILDLGYKAIRLVDKNALQEAKPSTFANEDVKMLPRAPIVCVMGHVDHGKTTLLDGLRNVSRHAVNGTLEDSDEEIVEEDEEDVINVAATEAGGITQKLSAFSVQVNESKRVVFLDTPGHAAFSSMRTNGALATDLVVLVVAMDDGVRPQTVEAIKVALDAKCNVIIALNKIDKFRSKDERRKARERVLLQLMEHNLVAEEYGGKVEVVEVSGKSGENLPSLVDSILLQAEVMELSAAHDGQAEAVVLDAHMNKKLGVVSDVLVKWGKLSVGDAIVVGSSYGRVKSMTNDQGEDVEHAYPADSVRLTGLRTVPSNGQEMISVVDEIRARLIGDRRRIAAEHKKANEESMLKAHKLAVEQAAAQKAAAGNPELFDAKGNPIIPVAPPMAQINVILKADGVGTVEALTTVVKGVASRTSDIIVNIVNSSVGDINMNDLSIAEAAGNCDILAFNVKIADAHTRSLAKENQIPIETSNIVYRLEDHLIAKMEQMMPSEKIYTKEGTARLKQVFVLNTKAKTVIAGLQVTSGKFKVSGQTAYAFRIIRDGKIIATYDDEAELKRFKEVVHEVESGLECGLSLGKFTDLQVEDEIECLKSETKKKKLHMASGASGAMHSDSKEYNPLTRY